MVSKTIHFLKCSNVNMRTVILCVFFFQVIKFDFGDCTPGGVSFLSGPSLFCYWIDDQPLMSLGACNSNDYSVISELYAQRVVNRLMQVRYLFEILIWRSSIGYINNAMLNFHIYFNLHMHIAKKNYGQKSWVTSWIYTGPDKHKIVHFISFHFFYFPQKILTATIKQLWSLNKLPSFSDVTFPLKASGIHAYCSLIYFTILFCILLY